MYDSRVWFLVHGHVGHGWAAERKGRLVGKDWSVPKWFRSRVVQRWELLRGVWHRPSFRTRLLINFLAYLGATTTLYQLLLWISNRDSLGSALVNAVLLIGGAVIVLLRTLPSSHLKMRHSNYSAEFELRTADIFAASDAPIVVTANRNFDVSGRWVSEHSLVALLAENWFAGSRSELKTAIGLQVAGTAEAPIGTIVRLDADLGTALLLGVARRDPVTTSTALVKEIAQAESALWEYVRANNLAEITVPLIGAGFSRTKVGPIPLLMVLLISYVTASMEVPTCRLQIVLGTDVNLSTAIEVVREFADALGFVEID
jgi:hypothetical protein